MPLNVFRLHSALPGGSKPGFPIVTGISANCIHCSYTGLRNRVLIDGASLSFVYFASPCLLPSICSSAFYLSQFGPVFIFPRFCFFPFFFPFFSRFHSIIFRPCRPTVFLPQSFRTYCIYFLSFAHDYRHRVAGFTLVTSPISAAPFFAARVLLHFRARCRRVRARARALSIGGANYERRMERFEDLEGERNYDVHGDNPFSPQLLTVNS